MKEKETNEIVNNLPATMECHCTANANKYRHRIFINQLDQMVIRIFYRCENCWSRIKSDFIPELDNKKTVNVSDLLKNYR